MRQPPNVLVSACLLGRHTRYDGDHKDCAYLHDTAFADFNLVAICPELDIGLGVPRNPINLWWRDGKIGVLSSEQPALDVTQRLRRYSIDFTRQLRHFSGVILKKNSPSCGLGGVKLWRSESYYENDGRGEFAYQIQKAIKLQHLSIPVVDEDMLADQQRRLSFIRSVWEHAER